MNNADIEKLLHTQIPLAKAMNVRVVHSGENRIELTSPLEPNHNHLGTAFGGSLSALMLLAAYCRLFQLIEGKGHVVLKSSTMKFLKPVNEEIRAISLPASPEATQEFQKTYKKKGK